MVENSTAVTKKLGVNPEDLDTNGLFSVARQLMRGMYYLSTCTANNVNQRTTSSDFVIRLREHLKEQSLAIQNLTLAKFIRSIAEDEKLQQALRDLQALTSKPNFAINEELNSQLEKVKSFKLLALLDKTKFLFSIINDADFTEMEKIYRVWDFYHVIKDEHFRQKFIVKAIKERGETFSKNFEVGMNKYLESVRLGKEVVDQYLEEDEKVDVQAYHKMTDRVLHVNFTTGIKKIRTSDILEHDKNTQKLHIYCNKKEPEVEVSREGKARNYKFEKDAHYQMTSTWTAKDEHEKFYNCKMRMNIDSNGITEIVEFTVNGNVLDLSLEESLEESLKLIGKNKELSINGQPLLQAVNGFLVQQRNSRDEKVPNQDDIKSASEANKKSSLTKEIITNDTERDLEPIKKTIQKLEVELQKLKQAVHVTNDNVCSAKDREMKNTSNESKITELVDGNTGKGPNSTLDTTRTEGITTNTKQEQAH